MLKVPEPHDEPHILSSISEFRDLRLEQDLAKHIETVRSEIRSLQQTITEDLQAGKAIDQPKAPGHDGGAIRIKIGSEDEFYAIAGEESYDRRLAQLKAARAQEKKEGADFEQILGKDDSYMPKSAQREQLDKAFDTLQKFDTGGRRSWRCEVHSEPAYNVQVAHEREFTDKGKTTRQAKIAIHQYEIVLPPLSPEGFSISQAVLGQRIIDQAQQFGLKRAEIRTELRDMSCSSLHFTSHYGGSRMVVG